MADLAGVRRRRWSTAARTVRTSLMAAIATHRPTLDAMLAAARRIEDHALNNPNLVLELLRKLDRDQALIEQLLADLRTWTLDPRPDPLSEDERRLGWPADLKQHFAALSEQAKQHQDISGQLRISLAIIRKEVHTNPKLVRELAVDFQRDTALLTAGIANMRSELLVGDDGVL